MDLCNLSYLLSLCGTDKQVSFNNCTGEGNYLKGYSRWLKGKQGVCKCKPRWLIYSNTLSHTNNGLLPFSLCFLFHHLLSLSCYQQTSLLCFPAQTHTQKKALLNIFLCVVLVEPSGWITGKNLKNAPKPCCTDLQTHMSSKFLLIDSGIFGLVTRTAFITTMKKKKRRQTESDRLLICCL